MTDAPLTDFDLANLLRQLDLKTLNASVVDLSSMALQGAWSIAGNGQVSEERAGRTLDSLWPGGPSTLGDMTQTPADDPQVQKLSPRRWVLTWRLDNHRAAVAEAHFHNRRDTLGGTDAALVRYLCSASIRNTPLNARLAVPVWPQVERRSQRELAPYAWPILTLLLVAAGFAAWLAFFAVPQAGSTAMARHLEVRRLSGIADGTVLNGLSEAMATGDYGEVQSALDLYASLGYFEGALVGNDANRVIAMTGSIEGLRIGDPVPTDLLLRARSAELKLGSQRHGKVLLIDAPLPGDADSQTTGLLVGAQMAFAAALAAAALVAAQVARGRR